ncbi:MAG: hypothetical protein WB988_07960 [Candidatus Nitrosopolaris sp.]
MINVLVALTPPGKILPVYWIPLYDFTLRQNVDLGIDRTRTDIRNLVLQRLLTSNFKEGIVTNGQPGSGQIIFTRNP